MNNLDGITSALVALQLLSLCLPLMSDMALLSRSVGPDSKFLCMNMSAGVIQYVEMK